MIETHFGSAMALAVYATMPHFEFGTEVFGQFLFKDTLTKTNIEVKDYEIIIPEMVQERL